MKILLYSINGELMTLVPCLKKEGHDVVMYIDGENCKEVGDGFIFKTDDPDNMAGQADIIIFGDNSQGTRADGYRASGYLVWGGGSAIDKLEYDRAYGLRIAKECGIPTPETFEVHSVEDVDACLAEYFEKSEKCVIKIDGEEAAGSSFSFVARNAKELIDQVNHWDEDGLLKGKWSGIVQQFIEGIEVSIEAWWNGSTFSNHNITIEEKKLLTGDLGPNVGCAYNTVARITDSSKLFRIMLEPIAVALNGYTGPIDVNSIVDANGSPHFLEFTPRIGYDATPTLAYGVGCGNRIAEELGFDSIEVEQESRGPFLAGVRVWIPPYPLECGSDNITKETFGRTVGTPITYNDSSWNAFYPYDIKVGEGGSFVSAGSTGIIGVALGYGDDPAEAGKRAYKIADRIQVPNKGFRALDGYKRAVNDIPDLIDFGLIKIRS